MDWGDWEGATLDALRAEHGAAFVDNADRGLDFQPPAGESPRMVQARLQPCSPGKAPPVPPRSRSPTRA